MSRRQPLAPPSPEQQPVRRRRWRWIRCERGSVGPFILILLPALVGLAGLAYDGGMLFTGRREANNLAAAAARAGTNDLFQPSIYAGDPVMAPTARGSAQAFALSHGATTAAADEIDPRLMQVTVTKQVDVLFLGIFGVGTQTVTGHASSRVIPGVNG